MWQITKVEISPGTGSNCCKVDRTKTAVLPKPDLAWHKTSVPKIDCGIQTCWTIINFVSLNA